MNIDNTLLEIIACPICKGTLTYQKKDNLLVCTVDKVAYPIKDNIPILLIDEAIPTSPKD